MNAIQSAHVVSMKDYVDNQFEWQKRIDCIESKLLNAEARLRELSISAESRVREAIQLGETRLRESEITAIREAIRVFNINLTEYKAAANELRLQLKEEREGYTKTVEHDKDIQSVRQGINETNKTMDTKFESTLSKIDDKVAGIDSKLGSLKTSSDENKGRDRVITVLISLACSLVVGLILFYLNKK
jgi:chromosome segregation ATPase